MYSYKSKFLCIRFLHRIYKLKILNNFFMYIKSQLNQPQNQVGKVNVNDTILNLIKPIFTV